ncbi:MAG: hypothetical protein IKI27_04870 [Methanobrevibacter sp.]|nr:hypothetical protein [Methanobrevibacter sp.]
MAVVPLSEAAGIVGVQNCKALNFETRQMEPVVFMGIRNFTALAHANFDVKTFDTRLILLFLNNWDNYDLNQAGISVTRLEKYREILRQWRQDPQSFNVERELAGWLANMDDSNLTHLLQFIKAKDNR